jgi:hypothetical protein
MVTFFYCVCTLAEVGLDNPLSFSLSPCTGSCPTNKRFFFLKDVCKESELVQRAAEVEIR